MKLCLFGLLFAAFAGYASAQQPQNQPPIHPGGRQPAQNGAADQRPCSADLEKFCKGVQPGGWRLFLCLKAREAELSDACKAQIAQQTVKHPCMADMEKFCKDIKQGDGRMIKCLKDHQPELSAACKAAQAARNNGRGGPKPGENPGTKAPAGQDKK
jgi:hypothetical protein